MTEPRSSRLVIPILSAANFIIGMGAFMVIGMLNPVAEEFGITPSEAGNLMIFYGISYAILSPLMVALTGNVGRRRVLTLGLGLFAGANLAAALAPSDSLLMAARIAAAAGAGMVTPVAATVAAGLSAPERRARALAGVFFGFTLSQVLGVPTGGFIAYTFGWRTAFTLVFALSLPVVFLIWRVVPAGISFQPVSLGALGRMLTSLRHLSALMFTCFFVGGTYVVYTYISPLLTSTMGFERNGITLVLLLFGVGAVIGNLLGGQLTDRIGPFRTLALLAVVQSLVLPWLSFLPLPVIGLIVLVFAWSAFGWSFNAAQQTRLIGIDPGNASVLLALNAGGIYVGAAIGSWIGAAVISRSGLLSLGIVGGVVVFSSLGMLVLSERLNRSVR